MPTFSPSSGSPRTMSPSLEQYVEAIAHLLTTDKVCSVSDIADEVHVSRPAASRAVRELSEKKLVEHRAYGYVDLTTRGQSIADKLTERHEALYEFLYQSPRLRRRTRRPRSLPTRTPGRRRLCRETGPIKRVLRRKRIRRRPAQEETQIVDDKIAPASPKQRGREKRIAKYA